jgi:hypothetical protein
MRKRVFIAALASGLLIACSIDVLTPDKFRVVGVLTTHVEVDSTTCTLTWTTQVNDNRFPYIFEFTVAGDTGTLPDTGFMVAADSAFATGPASVQGTFRAPDVLVGWRFLWDTLSASDSAHVKACVVQ